MNCMIIFVVALLARVSNADDVDPKSCAGGYKNGETYESGRYWYECKDGERVPRGCLSEEGTRVDVESTFDTAEAKMQCVLNSDGYLAIMYKSCMFQGREQMVGDRYDDGQVLYSCKKDGNAVRTTAIGCIYQGQQVLVKEKMANGEQVYTCRKNGAKAEMIVTGCQMDGHKYTIGELYDSGALWYTCTDKGNSAVGCFHNNLRLKAGDQVREDGVIYNCRVDAVQTRLEPIGCLFRDSNGVEQDKRFDCFWIQDDGPNTYEMTCKYDKEKNVAIRVPVRCQYKGPEGTYRVLPGCYAKFGDFAVGCSTDAAGHMQVKTFTGDTIDPELKADCQ